MGLYLLDTVYCKSFYFLFLFQLINFPYHLGAEGNESDSSLIHYFSLIPSPRVLLYVLFPSRVLLLGLNPVLSLYPKWTNASWEHLFLGKQTVGNVSSLRNFSLFNSLCIHSSSVSLMILKCTFYFFFSFAMV